MTPHTPHTRAEPAADKPVTEHLHLSTAVRQAVTLLPAHPIAARQARQVLARVLEDWGRCRLSQAASLVVSELVTNAVACTCEPIVLTLTRQGDQVLIEVWDAGDGLPEAQTPGAGSEHGRGLILIGAYATTWDYRVEETGKTVWALISP